MKFLLVLALAAGVFLWYRNENIKQEEKARAAELAALEVKRAAEATPVPKSTVTTGNKLVYDPKTGRYVEQKSTGSSLNRPSGGKPTPRTMLDQPAHR